MKHIKIIWLLMLSLASLWGRAELPKAADLFASAPASVFPLLDRDARLDMIDYAANNLTTPTNNALDGRSYITAMTPESVTIKLSDSSTAQLVVLPGKGDEAVVALISTVAAPGLDSSISFYTPEWTRLPSADYFTKPEWRDWLTPGGDLQTVTSMTPFMLASYAYDPASSTLTLTNNLSKFLDEDIYEIISPSLAPSLVYAWNGKKFSKK